MNLEDTNVNTIGVIGGGYVGLVSGVCLASLGYQVGVVEIDPAKIEQLRQGKSTIYEPGLSELMSEALEHKRLQFFTNTKELTQKMNPEVVILAVGTPQHEDGSCNLDYVMQAAKDVTQAVRRDTVLVLKSTVPVGTARRVKDLVVSQSPEFQVAVVNNPEFLKEGSAVNDFMRPERVVLGGLDAWAIEKVKGIYESFLHNGHPLFVVDHESAELSKLASNLMLATRISLINQVSRLSSAVGADIRLIEAIMRSDSRIGSKYLYAGMGYGGSCFPKDVKSFIHQCHQHGVEASMAEQVDKFNDSQKLFFLPSIRKQFPETSATTIAVLGLAFKPETDDIRESPALDLIRELTQLGYRVKTYDPKAIANTQKWAQQEGLKNLQFCASMQEALEGTEGLVLATEWQEFQRLSPLSLKKHFKGRAIFDGKNIFKPQRFVEAGFQYYGVGR